MADTEYRKDSEQKDIIDHWTEQLDQAEKYRTQFTSFKRWDSFLKYYRGDWAPGTLPSNKIYSYIRTMVPRIYFRDPLVTVTPTRPELEWHARVVETLDNYLIRELNLKYELKKAILDSLLFGIGIIKSGYDSEFGYVKQQAVGDDGEAETSEGEETDSKIEYKTNVKSGMPWSLRVDPRDILFPQGYTDIAELPWICHDIIRPLDDVKEDPKYDKKARETLKGGYEIKYKDGKRNRFLNEKRENYCLLREISDAKYKRRIVISEDKILLSVEDECQVEGLPYDFIIFNPDPDSLWGISDIQMVEQEQLELNDARKQAALHRRISSLKFLFLKGAIKQDQLDKLIGGEIGPGVEIEGESITQSIQTMAGNTPSNIYDETQMIEKSIRETLGHGSNQSGQTIGSAGAPRTATEATIIDQGLQIREDERKDLLADTLTSVIRRWNQFVFKFWSNQKVVEVVGPEGMKQWISYTGEQLTGEYFLRIDPDSGMPVTRTLRYQQAKEIFTMLNGDPMTDQMMLRKILLRPTEWIDPSYGLLVSPQQQQTPMPMLDFMKNGGASLPGNPGGSGPMPGMTFTSQNVPPTGGENGAGVSLQMPPMQPPEGGG